MRQLKSHIAQDRRCCPLERNGTEPLHSAVSSQALRLTPIPKRGGELALIHNGAKRNPSITR